MTLVGAGALVLIVLSKNLLATFVALAIPLRDLVLMGLTPVMIRRGYRFEVNTLGKAATWLLYLGVGCSMVTRPSTPWPLWIFWTGFALAVASMALYAAKARKEIH